MSTKPEDLLECEGIQCCYDNLIQFIEENGDFLKTKEQAKIDLFLKLSKKITEDLKKTFNKKNVIEPESINVIT